MKIAFVRLFGLLVGAILLIAACGGDDGSIEVEDARYRLARSDLGAGYLTVTNGTDQAVTLEAASAQGVGRIELHESMAADDGTMAMQARPEGFVVEAGETISLEPGGKHLMLFDPTGTEDLTIDLDFGDDTISVVASFDAEASADMSSTGDMEGMDHSDDDTMSDPDDMDEMDDMDDDAMSDDS